MCYIPKNIVLPPLVGFSLWIPHLQKIKTWAALHFFLVKHFLLVFSLIVLAQSNQTEKNDLASTCVGSVIQELKTVLRWDTWSMEPLRATCVNFLKIHIWNKHCGHLDKTKVLLLYSNIHFIYSLQVIWVLWLYWLYTFGNWKYSPFSFAK